MGVCVLAAGYRSPFIPAKAGTQSYGLWPLDSRLRGNERQRWHSLAFSNRNGGAYA